MEKKSLIVDGLNFSNDLGFVNQTWNLGLPMQRIGEFVEAAKKSGYAIKIFIDAGIESEEAIAKWKSRREEEVRGEYRDVPQGLSTLMGDIFRSFNVEVFYSPMEADNDDCIASYAQAEGANILSNDKDFFRYQDRQYTLYGSFTIRDGLLKLEEKRPNRPNPRFPEPSPKTIISSTNLPKMLSHNPAFNTVIKSHFYRRGAPSSLVKLLGNPNASLVHLRQAIYAKLGVTQSVLEEWPEWDSKTEQVVWHSEKVDPSHEFDQLLDLPINSLMGTIRAPNINEVIILARDNKIRAAEVNNYKFAWEVLIYELYSIWHDNKISMLDLFKIDNPTRLQSNSDPVATPCTNWIRDGFCKFADKCIAKSGHHDCLQFNPANPSSCRRGKYCRFRHAK